MVTFEYIFMFSIFSFRLGRDVEAEFFWEEMYEFSKSFQTFPQ